MIKNILKNDRLLKPYPQTYIWARMKQIYKNERVLVVFLRWSQDLMIQIYEIPTTRINERSNHLFIIYRYTIKVKLKYIITLETSHSLY